MIKLNKITPYNGFYEDPNLGQQNNYAWSMEEMGDYIYVGTGRNIVFSVLARSFNIPVQYIPPVFVPKPTPDFNAEIWRYKKDGSEGWVRVFKADPKDNIIGFRFMIRYITAANKELLVAGSFSSKPNMLISEDGLNWTFANNGLGAGDSTRAMIEHNRKLYLGTMVGLGGSLQTILYETDDPSKGWKQVEIGTGGNNPRGEVVSMESYNGNLFIGTAPPGGFEVWRTRDGSPKKDDWKLVVDKGAGEALNELPLSMTTFRGNLYVGTGIWFGISSIDPSKKFVPPKGFDLIKIDDTDFWEVLIGNEAISPTQPTTMGIRKPRIPAGLGDISNAYCWQLTEYNHRLLLGTWDWSVLLPTFAETIFKNLKDVISSLASKPDGEQGVNPSYNYGPLIESIFESIKTMGETMGGDIWISRDGCRWQAFTVTGLRNPHNYGIRKLLPSRNGRLYIGTANPYEGCEVWQLLLR